MLHSASDCFKIFHLMRPLYALMISEKMWKSDSQEWNHSNIDMSDIFVWHSRPVYRCGGNFSFTVFYMFAVYLFQIPKAFTCLKYFATLKQQHAYFSRNQALIIEHWMNDNSYCYCKQVQEMFTFQIWHSDSTVVLLLNGIVIVSFQVRYLRKYWVTENILRFDNWVICEDLS